MLSEHTLIELYRPTWDRLCHAEARLPHALLLSAHENYAPWLLAEIWAKRLMCEGELNQGLGCGHCPACHWMQSRTHPDVRWLVSDAWRNRLSSDSTTESETDKKAGYDIVIDQVRDLESLLSLSSLRQRWRLILIYPAEQMNRNAANALLKMLEEPPPQVLFLLVSNRPQRMMPTILSRCQGVAMPLPKKQQALACLDQIAEPERWLAFAGGSPLAALEAASEGASAWLNLVVELCRSGADLGGALTVVAKLDTALKALSLPQKPLSLIIDAWQKWCHDLTLTQVGSDVRFFVTERQALAKLAARAGRLPLLHLGRELSRQRAAAEQPVNARLLLERLAIDYCNCFAVSDGAMPR